MNASLHAAISATISYLVRPLAPHYPASTVDTLHLALMSSLYVYLSPYWDTNCPKRDSFHRTLVLCPQIMPPAPIVGPASSAGVRWCDWILLLSKGEECEVTIDPGCVRVRHGMNGREQIVWQDETMHLAQGIGRRMPWDAKEAKTPKPHWAAFSPRGFRSVPSRAPSMICDSPISSLLDIDDFEDDFAMFGSNRAGVIGSSSMHSRTSSHSTGSSFSSLGSDLSHELLSLSLDTSSTPTSSASQSPCITPATSEPDDLLSELDLEFFDVEEAEAYYIDCTRTTVVEYECGKVGVLGGAVMLGVPQGAALKNFKIQKACGWA